MKLRNMTGIYLSCGGQMLLLYRQGGRVVSDRWIASAGGHFEKEELNDPKVCVLRELKEELNLTEDDLENLKMRYIGLRCVNGEIRQNYYFFASLLVVSITKLIHLLSVFPNRRYNHTCQNSFLNSTSICIVNG